MLGLTIFGYADVVLLQRRNISSMFIFSGKEDGGEIGFRPDNVIGDLHFIVARFWFLRRRLLLLWIVRALGASFILSVGGALRQDHRNQRAEHQQSDERARRTLFYSAKIYLAKKHFLITTKLTNR